MADLRFWATAAALALLFSAVACSARKSRRATLEPPDARDALRGFEQGEITATLETDEGDVKCRLDRHAPRALALFVGLATGRAKWRDPQSGQTVSRPLYDGRRIFRAIPGVLVQTGCPRDDGTGQPGYRIEVETDADDAARLSRRGVLVMARYTPPPGRSDPNPPPPGHVIGSQFGVALSDMRHLTGQVTVLGNCEDLGVVARIADGVAHGAQPMLRHVRIAAGSP